MATSTDSNALPRVARIIHAAIALGVLLLFGIFWVLGPSGGAGQTPFPPGLARILAGGVALVGLLGSVFGRRRLRPPATRGPVGFWQENLSASILIWALAEMPGVVGAVLWFLSGDPVLLALGAWSILLLVLNAPSRLQEA